MPLSAKTYSKKFETSLEEGSAYIMENLLVGAWYKKKPISWWKYFEVEDRNT